MLAAVILLSVAAYLAYHAYLTFVGGKRTSVFDLIKNPKYNLKNVEAPKLSGKLFLFFVNLLEFSPIGNLLLPIILKSSGFSILEEISVYNAPALDPIPIRNEEEHFEDLKHFEENGKTSCMDIQKKEIARIMNEYFASDLSKESYVYNTITYIHKLYKEKKITPLQVAKNILKAIKEIDQEKPSLKAVIKYDEGLLLRQAEESTKRFQEGKEISVFDGIPVTIKDELDLSGFTSTKGMKVTEYTEHVITDEEESNVAKSLRTLGVIFVGKANQNEIGICARGINVNFGSARNPYNLKCDTGGSSSGSGSGVGSGLVPLSIGTDGGGSVRVPSSLCGIYGLKPTHYRISTKQKSAPVAFSTCVAGPMTGSAIDLTLAFAAVAGRRSDDLKSLTQPRNLRLNEIRLNDPDWYNLNERKIGIHNEYFNDVKDSRISKLCRDFIENVFCNVYNAQIDDSIIIPLLEPSRVSHLVTIAGEMRNGMKDFGYFEYDKRSKLCPETRMSLLSQKYLSSSDYITAQRIRSHQMEEFAKLFEKVDVIALPCVGCVAPEFDEEQVKKGGLGVSDYDVLSSIMKFIFTSNFCGFPSVSIPIGFIDNKPVGLQLMAKWWDEVTLLKYCLLAEKYTEKKKPQKFVQIIAQ